MWAKLSTEGRFTNRPEDVRNSGSGASCAGVGGSDDGRVGLRSKGSFLGDGALGGPASSSGTSTRASFPAAPTAAIAASSSALGMGRGRWPRAKRCRRGWPATSSPWKCFIVSSPWRKNLRSSAALTRSFVPRSRSSSWMTHCSSFSFRSCAWTSRSSTDHSWKSRYTLTARRCPMRWARSIACLSTWGFQSWSKSTTWLALNKLMPKPPARVLNKYTKKSSSSVLKSRMSNSRMTRAVAPSRRTTRQPRHLQSASNMSKVA
mmetsp:Transcript_19724/g.63671  ORF Transcript_19724/g.63671 Transcript_19724/m.63671 type:complete len:262 (-) Transcript_19724:820-1605(-)